MVEEYNPLGDKLIYLIGSLKNREKIIPLAKQLRGIGVGEVFDDWISPGPEADDHWRDWERERGTSYLDALKAPAATHVFEFDNYHINRSDLGVMCMPCGKSGHLEFGKILGNGKRGYIVFDEEPERWDVMYQFADGLFFSNDDLIKELKENGHKPTNREPLNNMFALYQAYRGQGLSQANSKNLVLESIENQWKRYSGTEKDTFEKNIIQLLNS